MKYFGFVFALTTFSAFFTQTAFAVDECGLENRVVVSCKILERNNRLTICLKKGLPNPTVAYQYERIDEQGTPEGTDLYIERDIRKVHYADFGGKGRDLTSLLSFERGNYLYHVQIHQFDFLEAERNFGAGIYVFEGRDMIAQLTCDAAKTSSDGTRLVWDQLSRMGYKWCGGFGSYDFDTMRYLNCVTHDDSVDQVSGKRKPAQNDEHPALQEILKSNFYFGD